MTTPPPDGMPSYRVLTGPDDDAFCWRVSEALELGYHLHGSPAVTFNGEQVIVAQAMLWSSPGLAAPYRRSHFRLQRHRVDPQGGLARADGAR